MPILNGSYRFNRLITKGQRILLILTALFALVIQALILSTAIKAKKSSRLDTAANFARTVSVLTGTFASEFSKCGNPVESSKQILTQITEKTEEYDILIYSPAADGKAEEIILTGTDRKLSDDVDIPLNLEGTDWHIRLEPKEGWPDIHSILFEIAATTFILVFIIVLLFIRMVHSTRKLKFLEHDELTGLLTKHAFMRYAEMMIKENPHKSFDVLVADMENFKLVNSIYGDKRGDDILRYIGRNYAKIVQHGLCGRLRGDSFISIYESIPESTLPVFLATAQRIINNSPVKNLSIKYGVYKNIDKSLPINTICDRAHIAAKSIKHNYSKIIESYTGPLSQQLENEKILENDFEAALQNDEFKIWLQPKYDAKTEKLVGAEALVRWIKPDGSIIPPSEFIDTFENDGLIPKLDEYIFRKVCRIERLWNEQGIKIPISVNLSRVSLFQEGAIEKYVKIAQDEGAVKDLVPLELTETASGSQEMLKELAEQLKKAGFKIHMDDFGTGFSSLENLNILPFDVVKLDKSLIDFIGDPGGNELLRHIIQLAQYKNLYIVAEGVEREDQLEYLKQMNCNAIQGYYYSAPKPYEEFLQYLK